MNRKDRTRLKWNGWGWRGHQPERAQAPAFWHFVRDWLGMDALPQTPSVAWEDVEVPPGRFSENEEAALADIIGAAHVRTGDYERLFHALGRSYHDLVRLRTGRVEAFPDAVCYPATGAQVERLVRWADAAGCALVPYGGGSSVVGGVEAVAEGHARLLTLDTSRMDQLLDFDAEAGTVTFEAGVYGPALEAALEKRGATLGHFPQSFEFSTLGGWIAARSAGQSSDRYGKIEDVLVATRVATPAGPWTTGGVPASAAGPDLNELVAGSEGSFGVITEATVRVRPRPATRQTGALLFEDFDAGLEAARCLRRAEGLPLGSVRLSDAEETALFRQAARLSQESGNENSDALGNVGTFLQNGVRKGLRRAVGERPALMRVALAGARAPVALGLARAGAICLKNGGVPLGPAPGKRADHYAMPYLRDALMDRGVGVDTLETAAPWPRLRALRREVRAAIQQEAAAGGGHACVVMAHLSHSYATGASLYFTLLFPVDRAAPIRQWRRLKRAASDAIVAGGGTISHHHGVGRDHLDWMPAEKGAPGLGALCGAKAHLDPHGVMNPGKLLPATPPSEVT